MSTNGVRTLLVLVLVGTGGRVLSKGEQCVARLQAPEGSLWKNLGQSQKKVSLEELQQLVDKYGLTMVEGPSPPNAPQSLIAVTCDRRGDMWVGLPDRSASLDDEEKPIRCRFENMKDTVSSFLGFKNDVPKQYPDQPRRVYMKNYCGVKFPVSSKSKVAKRMHERTRKLERKMNSWQS